MFIAYLAALAATPSATAIDPASWFTPNDYPVAAMAQGVEGSVTFEVDVDAEGKPTACRIVVSSGSPILDQRTCDIVQAKARFKPAVGLNGEPVAGHYSNRAIWKMSSAPQPGYATAIDPASWFGSDDYPADAVKKGIEGTVAFHVDVGGEGKPIACRIAVSSGSPVLDQRTCEVVMAKARFKPAIGPDGKAVAGQYSNRAIWKMPSAPPGYAMAIDPASWFGPEDYPAEAVKQGIEGTVTFEAKVDASGKPTACRITVSSGSPILDRRTCEIVEAKGQFRPAVGPGGKAVAGRYSNRAIWKMPDMVQPAYRALLLDFSADPNAPACTIQSKGAEIDGPSCQDLVRQAQTMNGLGNRLIKVVYLISEAPGDTIPYRGEPGWGERVSYLASDTYYLNGLYPSECVAVAAEGLWAATDPCSGFPATGRLSQNQRKKAIKRRVETSVFAVVRPPAKAAH